MDYLTLLQLYMRHIIDCEGIDFVDMLDHYTDCPKFTQEQIDELRCISNVLRAE